MTIHFGPRLSIDNPAPATLKESPMSQSSLSLDHHLNELQQVAQELRVARTTRPAASTPNPVRLALGRAFLAAAGALLSDGRRSHVAAH
jgi:hypothetical protein